MNKSKTCRDCKHFFVCGYGREMEISHHMIQDGPRISATHWRNNIYRCLAKYCTYYEFDAYSKYSKKYDEKKDMARFKKQ